MSAEYIKDLEETIERLKKRLESNLSGLAVVDKATDPKTRNTIWGQILVGCVVFAKIVKRKDGWCGYVLDANTEGEEGYKYVKFAIKCDTFEIATEKCMKALALDNPSALRIYATVKGNNE